MIALVSCGSPTIQKTDNVPVEVVRLEKAQSFDTLLVIPTSKETYVYAKDGEYVGKFNNTTETSVMDGVMGTLVILLLTALLFLIIGLIDSNF